MANVWQAASNAGSGEHSKNFLIHQRTHLGLGQAPQRFSLCTCVCVGVCVCVLVLVCERHKCKNNYENFAGNAPPHNNNNNKNSVGRPAKSQNQMWKMFLEGGGEGRKENFLLGPLASKLLLLFLCFFYRLLPSFLLSCFHCHVKSGKKKPNKRVGGKTRCRERVREGDSNKAKHLNLHNFRSTSQM